MQLYIRFEPGGEVSIHLGSPVQGSAGWQRLELPSAAVAAFSKRAPEEVCLLVSGVVKEWVDPTRGLPDKIRSLIASEGPGVKEFPWLVEQVRGAVSALQLPQKESAH